MEIKRELIQLMSLMLFFLLSELVESAGAWQRCKRRARLTLSDKEGSPDKAHLHPCILLLLLSVSPFCLTFTMSFILSPSVCLYLFPLKHSAPLTVSAHPSLTPIALYILHQSSLSSFGALLHYSLFYIILKREPVLTVGHFNSRYLIISFQSVKLHWVI